MATIKFRRGTSYPNGLTAGEPAFRTDLDLFYIHDGVTAVWVGAPISANMSENSTTQIPTQRSVKEYVDNNIAGGAVASISGLTGAVGLVAGTAIDISTSGKTLTVSNTGVQSFNGSTGAVSFSNYVASAVAGSNITVSSATGNVTIGVTSTPSFSTITTSSNGSIGGNLTVTGNLTVNGTTTTVNTDTITVDDPIIAIGLSGGLPLSVSDGGKDRGIAFSYYTSSGFTGFFGFDYSVSEFIAVGKAAISSEVVTPDNTSWLNIHGKDIIIQDVQSDSSQYYGKLTTENSLDSNVTYQLPGWSGNVIVPSNNGTGGWIIKSNGQVTQPEWINPNAAGFTAYAATQLATARNIALTGNVTATGVAFDGTAGITLTTVIPSSTVTNAMLVNSGFTLGTTSITLGSTGLTLAGLSSVSATTFTGALSGNASTATALQTARTFSLTGNVTASGITFDGTGNVALSTTIGAGVVTNAMLVNSGFTLGSTNITLGSTGLTLAGLSSVTATTFNGSLNGTATTATNVTTTEVSSGTFYLVGATSANTSVGLQIDATATTPLSYAVGTGTLTCVKVEAIVDGGSY